MKGTADGGTTDPVIAGKDFAHPDALVSTEWLAGQLGDPFIRIFESDEEWGNSVRAPIEPGPPK